MKNLMKLSSIFAILCILTANTAGAYLIPGPSGPQQPAPYPGEPGDLQPTPGNPYPGDPYNPPSPPQPIPPQQGACARDLCVGERVFNVVRSREAIVVGIEFSGTYVLRFTDNGATGGGWPREDLALMRGCFRDLCVGSEIYNVARDSRRAQIAGIQSNGLFVLRFNDTGALGGNWPRSDLAVPYGCSADICVGHSAYNIARSSRQVTVVAVHENGLMVLRFMDTGAVGSNWPRSDLAVPRGCGQMFCVGQSALNASRNYRQVQIMAIDINRKYVLRFIDNGAIGSGWSDSDLVRQ